MNTIVPSTIVLKKVSYQYPRSETPVLKEIDLSVHRNELVAIMGRTGAGKTTLVSMLNGLIPHHYEGDFEGIVTVDNLDTMLYSVQTLASRVGLVLQDAETQIVGMTVKRDVAFGPCNLGFEEMRVLKNVKNAIETMGLSGLEQRSPIQLSGGEKQRLAIAGVLAMESSILIMDEPTSELDPAARRQLFETLARLKASGGYTILVTTHDSEEVCRFADRVVVLNDGRIVWQGKPEELFSNIERCREFGIRLLATAELAWRLKTRKLIDNSSLPLDVQDAVSLLAPIIKRKETTEKKREMMAESGSLNSAIIDVHDVHYHYDREREALKGISLSLRLGEFVALIGKNGAGKSTLAKHFNGLLKPSSGRVIVDGIDTQEVSITRLSRTVGFVFQNPDHQIFCPSVREEVEYGLRHMHSLPENEISERTTAALTFVGLGGVAHRHPFTLGKGERQKLAVASVLAVEPKVLIMDEPTTGLDWEDTVRMMDLIHELHTRGNTIVMITHDMELAAEHAQRIIVLKDGKIFADGTPDEIFLSPDIVVKASLDLPPIAAVSLALRDHGLSVPDCRMKTLEAALVEVL